MVGVQGGPTPAKTESQARVERALFCEIFLNIISAIIHYDGLLFTGGCFGGCLPSLLSITKSRPMPWLLLSLSPPLLLLQLLHQDAFTFSQAAALNCLPQVPQFTNTERPQQVLRLLLKPSFTSGFITAAGAAGLINQQRLMVAAALISGPSSGTIVHVLPGGTGAALGRRPHLLEQRLGRRWLGPTVVVGLVVDFITEWSTSTLLLLLIAVGVPMPMLLMLVLVLMVLPLVATGAIAGGSAGGGDDVSTGGIGGNSLEQTTDELLLG